ncbi:hypothetical protein [Streptomyces noursei]|uniref:hypothetical protein n=1 Tax=Streptomyces noursei TaxID=1971 RepID=UPI00380F4771
MSNDELATRDQTTPDAPNLTLARQKAACLFVNAFARVSDNGSDRPTVSIHTPAETTVATAEFSFDDHTHHFTAHAVRDVVELTARALAHNTPDTCITTTYPSLNTTVVGSAWSLTPTCARPMDPAEVHSKYPTLTTISFEARSPLQYTLDAHEVAADLATVEVLRNFGIRIFCEWDEAQLTP